MGQFGDKFRKEREAKKLSLDNVSGVTKIAARMLQAIEEEQFDELPGGVFNRGFIRAYAKHLGLDDEEAVTEYLACLRQAQIDAQNAHYQQARPAAPEKRPLVTPNKQSSKSQPPAPSQIQSQTAELPDLQLPRAEHVRPPRKDYPERRQSQVPWGLLAAGLAVVLLFVVWRNYRNTHAASPPTASAASPAVSAESSAKLSGSQPVALHGASGAGSLAPPTPVSKSVAVNPPTVAVVHNPHPVPQNAGQTNTENAAPPKGPNGASKTIVGDNDDVTVRLPRANSKPSAALLTLVIRATETSWVSVTADGQAVTQEKLIAPAHTSVRASREISVHVGNAAGVSFVWNGAEIAAQGAEGEVRTYVFDTQGMRVVPQSQP